MKRFFMLLLLLMLFIVPAKAEVIDVDLTVGEPAQVLLLDERDGLQYHFSAFMPMEWCTIVEENGAHYLVADPPAAGSWTFDLTLRRYRQNDKKGEIAGEYQLRLDVSPDETGRAWQAEVDYRDDGQGMVVVSADRSDFCRVPGGPVMGSLPRGERLIYIGLEAFGDEQWFLVYHRAYGYGSIPASQGEPHYAFPLEVKYVSGEWTEVTLWHTAHVMKDIRLQSHEATDGELQDYAFTAAEGDQQTWYTRMRIKLTGHGPNSRHQMTVASLDDDGYPVEVITIIATPEEE